MTTPNGLMGQKRVGHLFRKSLVIKMDLPKLQANANYQNFLVWMPMMAC